MHDGRPRRLGAAVLVALCATVLASGCGGGFSLDRFGADRSLTTSSIGNGQARPDSRASDEAAITATITAWMPGAPPPDTVPWVNSNTGSTGAIVRVSDVADGARNCRDFTVSRESFDGVGSYRGRACSVNGGPWQVESLQPG